MTNAYDNVDAIREIINTNSLDTQDGEGLSYWNEPAGVYSPAVEEEDELEQARR